MMMMKNITRMDYGDNDVKGKDIDELDEYNYKKFWEELIAYFP
jgi:hypothetical protein